MRCEGCQRAARLTQRLRSVRVCPGRLQAPEGPCTGQPVAQCSLGCLPSPFLSLNFFFGDSHAYLL